MNREKNGMNREKSRYESEKYESMNRENNGMNREKSRYESEKYESMNRESMNRSIAHWNTIRIPYNVPR